MFDHEDMAQDCRKLTDFATIGNAGQILLTTIAIISCCCMISGAMASQEIIPSQTLSSDQSCGLLTAGDSIDRIIHVENESVYLSIMCLWNNSSSKLSLLLYDPSGKQADKTDANGYNESDGIIEYFIENCSAGDWKVNVAALQTPGGNEEYCLTADQITPPKIADPIASKYKAAELNGFYSDHGIDNDFDGQIDLLRIQVGTNVMVPGMYNMTAILRGPDGAVYNVSNEVFLGMGARKVPLDFVGLMGKGRFGLDELRFSDINGLLLGEASHPYVTKEYDNFEPNPKMALLSARYNDTGIDANGDGFYEFLCVETPVEAILPGEYTLTGSLFDESGKEVVWAIDTRQLDVGSHLMQLDFDGKTIWKHGANGTYSLKEVVLSGPNMSATDLTSYAYTTKPYNASQFVDPVRKETVLHGVGSGELLVTITVRDSAPVYSGRYSYDIVGIHIPPFSTPWQVKGSKKGYDYEMPGIFMPGKPNNFSVLADGVKTLNIGIKKHQANTTRTWVTTQVKGNSTGVAIAENDMISPGEYHAKIFGDAAENIPMVSLTMVMMKKMVVSGEFDVAINTTGFPSGNYSIAAKALNGSFSLDSLSMEGMSIVDGPA
jgi:hypothetical protein